MADFTDDEIQAAVESLINGTIQRPYDTLGVKDTTTVFSDLQQAAAGIFLLYPKTPFYCLYLGAQNLLQIVAAEAATITSLLEAISATGRSVLPIEDVTPLFNAKTALEALGQAALNRSTNFKDIASVPAYQQFNANADRFLSTSGQAVKDGGTIVKTPQEARKDLPALVSQLQASHSAIVAKAKLISAGADDYASINLAGLVAQSVISKASSVLGAHADELSLLLPEQRLEKVRQVVLDLLAAKSVVTTYGSPAGSVSSYNTSGTGSPYADASHPAVPALLRANLSGPYNLQIGSNTLDLFLDTAGSAAPRTLVSATSITAGSSYSAVFACVSVPSEVVPGDVVYPRSGPNSGAKFTIVSIGLGTFTATGLLPATSDAGPVTLEVRPRPAATITLPYAFGPTLFGTKQETAYAVGNGFVIGNGTLPVRDGVHPAPNNNTVIFTINGVSHTVTLTLSANGNGSSVDATPRTAQQVCNDINTILVPLNYMAEPFLAPRKYLGVVTQSINAGASAFFDLLGGFGDFGALGIVVGEIINLTDGDVTQQGLWTITAVSTTRLTATNNAATTAIAQSRVTMEVGAVLRAIKVRAVDAGAAVNALDKLGVTYVGDSNGPSFNGAVTVGMTPGAVSMARKQTAKELVTALQGGSSLVRGQATLVPSSEGVAARSEPTAATRVVFSKLQGVATTVWASSVLTATLSGALTAGVVVGDKLVERGGNHINTLYTVTSVSNSAITATNDSGTPSSQTGITIELGADPSSLSAYDLLRVESGPNAGDYYVDSVSGLDITLLSVLPLNASPADGTAVNFTVSIGPEYLEVLSTTKTTVSYVLARGNAELKFFTHNSGVAGTTPYFRLPSKVRSLVAGDLLLLFQNHYNLPDAVLSITAVEDDVLTLDTAIPSNVNWAFGPTATVPFAKLESGTNFDFASFKALLDAWVAEETQLDAYFTDLNRFINPLISNKSPSGVQVGDALNRVRDLLKQLTLDGASRYGGSQPLEQSLDSFVVPHQPPVDSLLRSFREKGATRAVDILLLGQFQAFFALDQDDSTYAGAMQKAMRDVARNDLPLKKMDRTDLRTSRLLTTTQDTDPDVDLSDTENAVQDPVGQGDF